jgi:cyclophilin family peptidyl-prolyl cis-trans isomerase
MFARICLTLAVLLPLSLVVAAAQEKEKPAKSDSGSKSKAKAESSPTKGKAAASESKNKADTPAAKSKKAKAAASDAESSKAVTANPDDEFNKTYQEFKELVNRLQQIQQKYASDPNADKKALEQEFNDKVEQTKSLEVKVAAAAEAAYLAHPNENREQSEYLLARLNKLVGTDDFDEAARLTKLLADHDFEQKYFDLFAGLAYFGANDFDSAEKCLKQAEKKGELAVPNFPAGAVGTRTLDLIRDHHYKELWKQEQAVRATEEKAGDLPKVKLSTTKGDITLELFENQAPIATNNFVSLIEKRAYDGTKFHRVLPGFMAQGGDPNGDGSGGPGYTIPDECRQENHRNHFRGTLSMARTGQPNTGGSQFFICFQPQSTLDGQYTVFGRVVDGFDVLAKLQRCEPRDANAPDKINRATVISKRNHKYEPKVKVPDKK